MKPDPHPSDVLLSQEVADLGPKRKWFGYAAVAASLAVTYALWLGAMWAADEWYDNPWICAARRFAAAGRVVCQPVATRRLCLARQQPVSVGRPLRAVVAAYRDAGRRIGGARFVTLSRVRDGYVKRCLGLTLYVKFENPAGSRIQQCFIGGEELKRDGGYTAAFVTTQGVPKQYGCNRRDLDLHTIDALKRYCAAHPCVTADLRGTVIVV